MEFIAVKTLDDLHSCIRRLKESEVIGLDTETTALEPRDGELRLIQLSDGKNSWVIDCYDFGPPEALPVNLRPLAEIIESPYPRKVIHNYKFEYRWITRKLKMTVRGHFDTFIGSKLLDYKASARLDDVADRYLKIPINKDEQLSDWGRKELSRTQLEYAALDPFHLPELRNLMVAGLKKTGQVETARIEFDATGTIAETELAGFSIDPELWKQMCGVIEIDRDEKAKVLKDFIAEGLGIEFEPPVFQTSFLEDVGEKEIAMGRQVNLRSQQQILEAFRNMGVPLENTSKPYLESVMHLYPQLSVLIDFRKAEKLVGSYGRNILDMINFQTGRIHASFWQLGTQTGRLSCSNPNIQQVPKKPVLYRQACRPMLPGRKLVIADYSQLELRVLAHLSQDRVMIEAFEKGTDLHTLTASGISGIPYDQIDDKHPQRDLAKILNFGIAYGLGAPGVSIKTGKSMEEAEQMLRNFASTYPGMDKYLREIALTGTRNRFVRTLSGRMVRIDFDSENRSSFGKATRDCKNFPIQGSTGDILKVALPELFKRLANDKLDAQIVNFIHDEVHVECNEDDAPLVEKHVEESCAYGFYSFIDTVPCKAEAKTGDSWAEK